MGSTPYYVAAVSLYRMAERPYVLSGLGILLGYVKASLSDAPRMQDEQYLAFLRRFERDSLLYGKGRTARRYHERIRREVRRVRQQPPAELAQSLCGVSMTNVAELVSPRQRTASPGTLPRVELELELPPEVSACALAIDDLMPFWPRSTAQPPRPSCPALSP